MKNNHHYSLVATRSYLLSAIWNTSRNLVKWAHMEMQYRQMRHELTCALITLDVSLGRGAERSAVAADSGRSHRQYVGRALK